MAGVKVLLEVFDGANDPFERHSAATESINEAERQATDLLGSISGLGIELDEDVAPVPMFVGTADDSGRQLESLTESIRPGKRRKKISANSYIVPAEVSRARMEELTENPKLKMWPNSQLTLLDERDDIFDAASSRGGVDCRPFRDGVSMSILRRLLGIDTLWNDGFKGQNIVVGIIDEGVNGDNYPVIGGFSRPSAGLQPGEAGITSHGSMCAADVMLAAPAARLYDYPFLGVPRSGGALQMFQAVLNQRRLDGTPQVTNNSYGFVGVPDPNNFPDHEVNNANHPVHRKVREVVAAGVTCLFAAGNCGQNCPSGSCHSSGIGPGLSIHASNSLEEVITVAAVNSVHERVGYSSQGPGMFFQQKPDVASYTHFFGNFGPDRPGGPGMDNGTSAATPVAAGVAAALLSAAPSLDPAAVKQALIDSATQLGGDVGWNRDYGYGVINAAAAYSAIKRTAPLVS